MEIIKIAVDEHITKVEIGGEYNESTKTMSGQVELDIETQAYFVEIVNSIIEDGGINIAVDMQLVSYVDSSGLWALFEEHKKAVQKGGKLVLIKPSKDVKRVLDITKMSSKIDIFESEEDAVGTLRQ
jgi:anti-sigma B factor antagonist